jgi:cytochrome c553
MSTTPLPCWRAALAVGLALAAQASQAQAVSPSGRLLASNCFQCHGTNGRGPGFDSLAGKPASEIYGDLAEMRSGKEGQGLMTRHAMTYTDAQLRQLAAWFAAQPAR